MFPGTVLAPEPPPRRVEITLWVLVLALGLAARVSGYVANRSFWVDEAMLALALIESPWTALWQPLPFDQVAPPLYALITKALGALLGNSERALRFLPFLAAVAALLVFPRFALGALRRPGALAALALFALAPALIRYANELKQYQVEVLATLLVALCFLRRGGPPGEGADFQRWLVAIGVVGAAGQLVSFSLVVPLAVWGLVAMGQLLHAGRRRDAALVLVPIAAWLAVFAANYLRVVGPTSASDYMQSYWADEFLAPMAGAPVLAEAERAIDLIRRLPADVFSVTPQLGLLALVMLVAGGVLIARREGPALALMVVGPLVLLLVLSAVGKVPLSARVCLWAVPLACVGIGAIVDWVAEQTRWTPLRVAVVAALLLFAARPLGLGALSILAPPPFRDVRGSLADVAARIEPGDRVWLYCPVTPTYRYYTRHGGLDFAPAQVLFGSGAPEGGTSACPPIADRQRATEAELEHLTRTLPTGRLWLVFSQLRTLKLAPIRELLKSRGTLADELDREGATVLLWVGGS